MRYHNSKDIIIKELLKEYKRTYYNQETKIWATVQFNEKFENAFVAYNELRKCITYLDFEKIIGNNSWTRPDCEECHKESLEGIYFNDDNSNYDRGNFFICLDCLSKANKLISIKE